MKLFAIQQHYKDSDFKKEDDEDDDDTPVQPVIVDAEEEQQPEEEKPDEAEAEAAPETEQIVEEKEEEEEVEEREPEVHDDMEQEGQKEETEETFELYDPNDTREIEVNVKHKASSLKKIILEQLGLFKKANVILFKKNEDKNPEAKQWIEFSQKDLDQQVKNLTGQTIAFRVRIEFTIKVDGRGQSFLATLKVDPKDQLDRTLKKNTHFWKQFMCGASPKCLMMVANKGEEDMEPVTPDSFQHDFASNGVFDKATVTLYEISKIPQQVEDSDYDEGGEGGEDENEEMEDGSMND